MIWLLLGTALAADCVLPAPADQPFEVTSLRAPDVIVLIELWHAEAKPAWTQSVLGVLEQRSLHGSVVLDTVPEGDWAAILTGATARGHALGLQLEVPVIRTAGEAEPAAWNRLKKPAKGVAKATGHRPRMVAGDIPNRPTEALLGAAGYRIQLPTWPEPGAAAHLAARFEGRMGVDVVLPAGPYDSSCTRSPIVGPFTPAAADRASEAIRAAVGTALPPIVRVGLDGNQSSEHDPTVLARWLDEVIEPSGAKVLLPEQARSAVLERGRAVVNDPEGTELGGRILSLADVSNAARGLENLRTIPRSLPGEVNPTELFAAALLVLTRQTEGEQIRLSALKGPPGLGKSTLAGEVTLDREAVVAMATQLSAAMPERIPAALTIDGQALTAPELLLLFASAVTEDQPRTRPIAVPEPNEEGLGWGESTVP